MKATRITPALLGLFILLGTAQSAQAGFGDWLASYLLGKAADAIFDPLTGRPDTRELDRRLKEAERRAAQQEANVTDIVRDLRRSMSPTMTKQEYRALVKEAIGDVTERLARVEKRVNDHETRLSRVEEIVLGSQGSSQRATPQVQRQTPAAQQATGDDPVQLAAAVVAASNGRRKGLLNVADPDVTSMAPSPRQQPASGPQLRSRGTGTYIKGTVTRVFANVAEFSIGSRDGLRTGDRVLLLPAGSRSGGTLELKVISTLDGTACGRCDAGQLNSGDTVVFLRD